MNNKFKDCDGNELYIGDVVELLEDFMGGFMGGVIYDPYKFSSMHNKQTSMSITDLIEVPMLDKYDKNKWSFTSTDIKSEGHYITIIPCWRVRKILSNNVQQNAIKTLIKG